MYGGYLPSAAALLICMTAGREGEHAVVLLLRFHHSDSPEWRAGDGVFVGSQQSAEALLICMPVGRLGERAIYFFIF